MHTFLLVIVGLPLTGFIVSIVAVNLLKDPEGLVTIWVVAYVVYLVTLAEI